MGCGEAGGASLDRFVAVGCGGDDGDPAVDRGGATAGARCGEGAAGDCFGDAAAGGGAAGCADAGRFGSDAAGSAEVDRFGDATAAGAVGFDAGSLVSAGGSLAGVAAFASGFGCNFGVAAGAGFASSVKSATAPASRSSAAVFRGGCRGLGCTIGIAEVRRTVFCDVFGCPGGFAASSQPSSRMGAAVDAR